MFAKQLTKRTGTGICNNWFTWVGNNGKQEKMLEITNRKREREGSTFFLNLCVYLQLKKQALPSLTSLNMRLCPCCFWYTRGPHRGARELDLPFTWAHPSQCSCVVFWGLFCLFWSMCGETGVCSILSLKWLSQHVLVLCQQPLSRWLMAVVDNATVQFVSALEGFDLMIYFIYSFPSGSKTIVAICPHFSELRGNLCKEYRDKW